MIAIWLMAAKRKKIVANRNLSIFELFEGMEISEDSESAVIKKVNKISYLSGLDVLLMDLNLELVYPPIQGATEEYLERMRREIREAHSDGRKFTRFTVEVSFEFGNEMKRPTAWKRLRIEVQNALQGENKKILITPLGDEVRSSSNISGKRLISYEENGSKMEISIFSINPDPEYTTFDSYQEGSDLVAGVREAQRVLQKAPKIFKEKITLENQNLAENHGFVDYKISRAVMIKEGILLLICSRKYLLYDIDSDQVLSFCSFRELDLEDQEGVLIDEGFMITGNKKLRCLEVSEILPDENGFSFNLVGIVDLKECWFSHFYSLKKLSALKKIGDFFVLKLSVNRMNYETPLYFSTISNLTVRFKVPERRTIWDQSFVRVIRNELVSFEEDEYPHEVTRVNYKKGMLTSLYSAGEMVGIQTSGLASNSSKGHYRWNSIQQSRSNFARLKDGSIYGKFAYTVEEDRAGFVLRVMRFKGPGRNALMVNPKVLKTVRLDDKDEDKIFFDDVTQAIRIIRLTRLRKKSMMRVQEFNESLELARSFEIQNMFKIYDLKVLDSDNFFFEGLQRVTIEGGGWQQRRGNFIVDMANETVKEVIQNGSQNLTLFYFCVEGDRILTFSGGGNQKNLEAISIGNLN